MQNEKSDFTELEILRKELHTLNERLARVEVSLEKMQNEGFQPGKKQIINPEEDFEVNLPFQSKDSFEFSVGEYGMAWIGNIILLFGIIFLIGYLQNTGNPILSIAVGFIAVAGLYVSSFYTLSSYSLLSKLFAYNGHLLLFYIALRLHYFQENPLVKSEPIGFSLIIIVTLILLYQSIRKHSQLMAGLVLLMMVAAGIISKSVLVTSIMATAVSAIAIVFYYRFGWLKLAFTFIFIIYLSHLNWLLNNPVMGNNPEFIPSPGMGYFYFIATGFIFSMIALIPKKEQISEEFIIASVIWNGLGFTFILALIIFAYFLNNYVPLFVSITLFCLLYSIILKLRSSVKITASMYVLYGFLALSVAIFGIAGLPKSYMFFAFQSLMVVAIALWFQSRFMVVMNTFLFLFFMIIYLKEPVWTNGTNFTFMLVALISARVINWKKERLKIKTEFVRNLYLVSGFVMTLVAFYHAFPATYITASWIIAAILFFLLSVVIKNIKYRWLAIAAMVASAIRLVFVDMSNINIGYRVLVFLSLAVISISLSVVYTKYFIRKRKDFN
jgi:hypothetical protein